MVINNGNWTEWSAIWVEIERACSASSIWNHKYDFRLKLHDTRFNYHFITSILKFPNKGLGQFKYFIDAVQSRFENSSIFGGKSESFGNKSCKIFSAIWSVTLNKPWNLIGCFDFSVASHWLGKRCNLKQKMVRFVNKSLKSVESENV